jgi:hypothetical protein
MAKVYSLPDADKYQLKSEDYHSNWAEKFAAMEKLEEQLEKDPFALYGSYMDQPDKDGVVGTILRFGVADGRASYLVMRKKPLTLCFIPSPDGYQADECTLRGVNLTYVKQCAKNKKLFGW